MKEIFIRRSIKKFSTKKVESDKTENRLMPEM